MSYFFLISAFVQPFEVRVYAENDDQTQDTTGADPTFSTGFNLQYTQLPCQNAMVFNV